MVRKRDDYPTKHGEIREYWSCDRCGPRVPSNVTGRRRSASLVGDVLGRFYGGASIPNIETGLLENGTKLSPDTILDYAVAFPHLISRFLHWIMQMYGLPNVGNHWQVDEKPVMVQGVQCWILAVIDVTTEFVLVLRFIRSRTIENLENGLREARLLAKKCPLITETDALSGYDKAVRRALGDATHWKVKKSEWYGVNNLIETFNSRLEAFFRVRKGLHEFNTAQHILDGVWIHETVVKKSKSQYLLHQTTAQAAGLGIKLKRPWTDLLSLAEKAALKGHIKFLRPARQKHMDQWLSTPKQTLLRGPKKKQTLLSASHA